MLVCDESKIVDLLNSYFASTFTHQLGELSVADIIYLGGKKGLLEELQIGIEEVKKQENLKNIKATGSDNMHPRVLREVADQLSDMLTL